MDEGVNHAGSRQAAPSFDPRPVPTMLAGSLRGRAHTGPHKAGRFCVAGCEVQVVLCLPRWSLVL